MLAYIKLINYKKCSKMPKTDLQIVKKYLREILLYIKLNIYLMFTIM